MLKIRLQRVGRVHEPSFRLVLTDSKNGTKSGKYLENLGNYDSRRGHDASFKENRITYWITRGAQTSPTVHNLLVSKKLIVGKKINKLPLKKAIVKKSEDMPAKTEVSARAIEDEAKEEEAEASPEVAEETVA